MSKPNLSRSNCRHTECDHWEIKDCEECEAYIPDEEYDYDIEDEPDYEYEDLTGPDCEYCGKEMGYDTDDEGSGDFYCNCWIDNCEWCGKKLKHTLEPGEPYYLRDYPHKCRKCAERERWEH